MIVTIVSGCNRKNSTTSRLCGFVASQIEAQGHEVRLFDVHEKPLPLMCEGEDYGDNVHVTDLKTWMKEADAIVLATPEYHGSLSGALKNAIDFLWPEFSGKPVMSVAVAGGAVATSSLIHLQTIVRQVHGINSPEWVSLGGAQRELKESGEPCDEKMAARVGKATTSLLTLASKLRG